MEIHVSRDGGTFGPYSEEEFLGYFDAGDILATDNAWASELGENWKSAQAVSEQLRAQRNDIKAASSPAADTEINANEGEKSGGVAGITNLVLFIAVACGIFYYTFYAGPSGVHYGISNDNIYRDLDSSWRIFHDQAKISDEFDNKRGTIAIAQGKTVGGSVLYIPYLRKKGADGNIESTIRFPPTCQNGMYTNKPSKNDLNCIAKMLNLID